MSERIEAALRMLLDSGDITPMGARIVRQVAEAEVERLTAELDGWERRIAAALAFCDEFSGVQVAVTTARILRGGS